MRKLVIVMALLGCLPGCVPATIVEADGPRVTYAWNSTETELSRVYQPGDLLLRLLECPAAADASDDYHRRPAHHDLRLRPAADHAVRAVAGGQARSTGSEGSAR